MPGQEQIRASRPPSLGHVQKNYHFNERLGYEGKMRANQWKYADYDGDRLVDLIIGQGIWTEYGWDDAFDSQGNWTRGPLHGYVYIARNTGTNDKT